MSLPGPILVVSDHHDRKLMAGLAGAGAFPVVECKLAEAAVTIGQLGPAAVVLADPDLAPAGSVLDDLIAALDAAPAPFVPVVARVKGCGPTALDVLPVDAAAGPEQVVARTAAARRVRILHATVLRRIDTLRGNGAEVAQLPAFDPMDEATVLVAGRGRTYPALTTAVRARVGVLVAIGKGRAEASQRRVNLRIADLGQALARRSEDTEFD